MNNLTTAVQQYIATLHDAVPEFHPAELAKLPLHLRNRYSFLKGVLFGKEWVLAIEDEDWEPGTPTEYRKQVQILASHAQAPVALVLRTVTSTLRNRLIRANVPFIVPRTQIFLPISCVSLTERNLNPTSIPRKYLTPTAQLLVLYEIIRGGLSELAFKDIAATLKCSGPMVTKARAELESRGICEVEPLGKETRMRFTGGARAIWKAALPSLGSPVVRTRWVQWDAPTEDAKRAGLTALSDLALISDDNTPTYAIYRAAFTGLLERGQLRGWPDRNGAHAAIQCWSYDPGLLSDEPHVDALSLNLSLRSSHSERVQGELESLLETFPWR